MQLLNMEHEPKRKRILSYKYLFLGLIVVIGFTLRFYYIQFYLSSGSTDSVGYSYSALIYSRGELTSPSATPKGFLFVLFMALFYNIFGPTLLAGQLVSLLFGGLLPVATYFLGSELFNKKIGLLTAFIIAINPLLILYSSLVFREMLFSFMLIFSIYFALRGFKGNTFATILGGIFFALASMTIEIGIFGAIGFVAYFVIQKAIKNKGRLGECKNLDLFLAATFLTLIPLFIRDYLAYGNFLYSWLTFEYYITPITIYFGFLSLSVPYLLLSRLIFHNTKLPSINRFSTIIKDFLIVIIISIILLIVSYFSGLYTGSLAFLAAQSFTGFIKLAEYLTFPESLGLFLLFFFIIGIFYGLKSRNERALTIFSLLIFLFSYVVRAATLSENYNYEGWSLIELITWTGGLQQVTWPFQVIFRYFTPFIPLISIFSSYGIFFLVSKLIDKLKGNPINKSSMQKNVQAIKKKGIRVTKNRIFKTGLILAFILVIILQNFYAQADLFARADAYDSYENPTRPANVELPYWMREGGESLSLIDWLKNQGSPVVYGYNTFFKEKYGEDKVILLTGDENLLDIVKRAREDGVDYIISDAYGDYCSAQYSLFWGGIFNREPRLGGKPVGYFELVRSYTHWHMAQVFKIAHPQRTALVFQGSASTGAEWTYFLSNSSSPFLVQTVDDEEQLTPYLNANYDVIVLAEIQRHLHSDELSLLREKVEGGTILIMNGISPAYLDLEENSDWLGAKNFEEAPREAKWNIKFTEDAIDILSQVNLDRNYALYSQSLYSSPTGLTNINPDVTVYATRVEDGAVTIFANPYGNGVVIFSGVRHTHASKATDYDLYLNFIENLLERSK